MCAVWAFSTAHTLYCRGCTSFTVFFSLILFIHGVVKGALRAEGAQRQCNSQFLRLFFFPSTRARSLATSERVGFIVVVGGGSSKLNSMFFFCCTLTELNDVHQLPIGSLALRNFFFFTHHSFHDDFVSTMAAIAVFINRGCR